MTKRLVMIAAAIMTTVLLLVVLWQFRVVLIFVVISLLLSATFRPIAGNEARQDIPTRILSTLRYVVALVILGVSIFLVGRLFVNDLQQLTAALSVETTWQQPAWMEGSAIGESLARWLPSPDALFAAITSQRQLLLSVALGLTEGLGGLVSGLVIVVFLSVYWSINQDHFERLWLSILPVEQRKRARFIWRTIEHDLGAYTRSELIQSLLAVVLLGLGYWLLGSPYPALLAVTSAIAWLVPVVGVALALILPIVLGLLTSAPLSLLAALYTLVVLLALQIWVEPRFFKPRSDNPFLTFVILLVMADAFGLLGIIAAPPIAIIYHILWRLLISDYLTTDVSVRILDIKERYKHLQESIEGMDGSPPPKVVSSMERLEQLLAEAEPLLETDRPAEQTDILQAG